MTEFEDLMLKTFGGHPDGEAFMECTVGISQLFKNLEKRVAELERRNAWHEPILRRLRPFSSNRR